MSQSTRRRNGDSESCRSGRHDGGSALATRTKRRGSGSVCRTSSMRRSCARRSRSRSRRRTSGWSALTSSSTVAANAATGVGIGPNRIDRVIGVAKAYVTRVGEGPFPTEIDGPDQERVQELGGEFGTVTGRVRRCGWLDLVALRYAVRLNGITSLALTKLDVLSTFEQVPVCVAYRLRDGSETSEFPAHQSDFHHCLPVYETLSGWQEPITDGLPDTARAYVEFIEQQLGVEISLVGTGAERERVVALR